MPRISKTIDIMSDKEIQQQMDAMRALDKPMPQVGIFWFDPNDRTFFGVRKQELTPKRIEEFAAKGVRTIDITTLVPQFADTVRSRPLRESVERVLHFGRVAWNINKFIVFVGQWAKPIEEELSEMIEKEFALPYFGLVYDEHWDLGHGWSGDM